MYQLPCPHCQHTIEIAVSKAGDQLACPSCGGGVKVPRLGDLKRLPRVDSDESNLAAAESASGKSPVMFIGTGLVAVVALLAAGFCGLRWFLLEVPMTTEEHIRRYRQEYEQVMPAALINEYEDMEKYGPEMMMPNTYIKIAERKQQWGQSALASAGLGALALVGVVFLGSQTRPPRWKASLIFRGL